LRKLGLEVGSDVPFSITGGTYRARGRGDVLERLEPLNPLKDIWVVIAMPDETVETAWAYSLFNENDFDLNPDMDAVVGVIGTGDPEKLAQSIKNAFERKVAPFKPSIKKAAHDILSTKAFAASMTGSGAGVFGLYGTYYQARSAGKKLEKKYDVFVCRMTGEIF
jgi:4-diphosphocytidyl-2-C-methyl-D-erythritol kinase